MQYLLTEIEYQELLNRETVKLDRVAESARVFILKQANFTCIHETGLSRKNSGYCDDCPLTTGFSPEDRKELCKKSKNYSQ